MKIHGTAKLTAGETGVDPVASPDQVEDAHLITLAGKNTWAGTRLLLLLGAPPGESATVTIYALVGDVQDVGKEGAVYAEVAAGVVLTGGELTQPTLSPVPAGGDLYMRVTAETLTGTRPLFATWAA